MATDTTNNQQVPPSSAPDGVSYAMFDRRRSQPPVYPGDNPGYYSNMPQPTSSDKDAVVYSEIGRSAEPDLYPVPPYDEQYANLPQ